MSWKTSAPNRRLVTRMVIALLMVSAASCADAVAKTVAPTSSRSLDCLECADGSSPPPALTQPNGVRLSDGRGGPSLVLPDPNATGPETDAERAKFGGPTATGATVLADVHFEGTQVSGDAGIIATGGSAIVSMDGTLSVWNNSMNPVSVPLHCRGWTSCWNFAYIGGTNCYTTAYSAHVVATGTVWTLPDPKSYTHSSVDTCTPSPTTPPPGGTSVNDPPGMTCHDEQVTVTTDGGNTWTPETARVCESGSTA